MIRVQIFRKCEDPSTRKLAQDNMRNAGGRVLGVVAIGDTLKEAIDASYANVKKVHFENAFYRKDIGKRAMEVFNEK